MRTHPVGMWTHTKNYTEEEQTVINQAKKVLMEKNNMSENEAHRYVQKSAMDSGRTMVETAVSILAIMYKE